MGRFDGFEMFVVVLLTSAASAAITLAIVLTVRPPCPVPPGLTCVGETMRDDTGAVRVGAFCAPSDMMLGRTFVGN